MRRGILTLVILFPLLLNAGWNPYKEENKNLKIYTNDYKINKTINDFLKKQPRLKLFFE